MHAHTFVVAAIAIPYFGLMAGLFCYLCAQVRHHEQSGADEEERDRDRAEMRLAA